MNEPLSTEQITEMLQHMRSRNNYRAQLESFLGRKLTPDELREHKLPVPLPTKEERICKILTKRYNVPESLVQSLIEEIRDEYSDW